MDRRIFRAVCLFLAAGLIAACGGGGGSDAAAPVVRAVTPAMGEAGVSRSELSITIDFDQPMSATSLAAALKLSDGQSDFAPESVTLWNSDKSATFLFSAILPRSTEMTATLARTASATDGTALAADYTWQFVTSGFFQAAVADSKFVAIDNFHSFFPLSNNRVLVLQSTSVDPATMSMTIIDRESGETLSQELKSISAGSTPFWIFYDFDEAENGDIAIAMILRNSSAAYEVAAGSGGNADAYLFHYDASDDSWSEHVIMEDMNRNSAALRTAFDSLGNLMVLSYHTAVDYTDSRSDWHARDVLTGNWTSDPLVNWSYPNRIMVVGDTLWGLRTVSEMDTDGATRYRLYAYSMEIRTATEQAPILLTSDQPGDVAASDFGKYVDDDVIHIGLHYGTGTGKIFEGLLLDTVTRSVVGRHTSPEIDNAFKYRDFERVGEDHAWLLIKTDATNLQVADLYLLVHNEADGWQDPLALAPGSDSESFHFITDEKIQPLSTDALAITWQNCDHLPDEPYYACETNLAQYLPGEGINEAATLLNDFETSEASSDVEWYEDSDTLLIGTSPDMVTWYWFDFE